MRYHILCKRLLIPFWAGALLLAGCSGEPVESSQQPLETESGISEPEQAEVRVPEEVPEIGITLEDGTEIPCISAIHQWNGMAVKRAGFFSQAWGTLLTERPEIPTGAVITIDFGEYPPESVTVTLQERQTAGESTPEDFATIVEASEEADGRYTLVQSTAQLPLASDVRHITGYSITAKWGDNICAYGFLMTAVRPEASGEESEAAVSASSADPQPETTPVRGADPPQTSTPAAAAASTSSQASAPATAATDADSIIKAYFRANGMTVHQDAQAEANAVKAVRDAFAGAGIPVTQENLGKYVTITGERNFTCNVSGATASAASGAAQTPPASSAPAATGSIYQKPYDINAIKKDLWVTASALGFTEDTSITIGDNNWRAPVQTAHSDHLEDDLKWCLRNECDNIGTGPLHIYFVSDGNGEYTIYFLR